MCVFVCVRGGNTRNVSFTSFFLCFKIDKSMFLTRDSDNINNLNSSPNILHYKLILSDDCEKNVRHTE